VNGCPGLALYVFRESQWAPGGWLLGRLPLPVCETTRALEGGPNRGRSIRGRRTLVLRDRRLRRPQKSLTRPAKLSRRTAAMCLGTGVPRVRRLKICGRLIKGGSGRSTTKKRSQGPNPVLFFGHAREPRLVAARFSPAPFWARNGRLSNPPPSPDYGMCHRSHPVGGQGMWWGQPQPGPWWAGAEGFDRGGYRFSRPSISVPPAQANYVATTLCLKEGLRMCLGRLAGFRPIAKLWHPGTPRPWRPKRCAPPVSPPYMSRWQPMRSRSRWHS